MSLRRLLVLAIFSAFLGLLPATAFGENSYEASGETQEAPLPRLDFQFDEPRMSVGFRGGWAFNRSNGEIYDFFTDGEFLQGLLNSDFDAPRSSSTSPGD